MKTSIALSFALLVGASLTRAQQTYPEAAQTDDAGFEKIFDGKTLTGWEGDPKYWRIEDGCLVGEVTPETLLKQNSFIVWRGGKPGDFELKVVYRISSAGNSGINYRSVEVDGVPFALRGYQADIDGEGKNRGDTRHTGNNYEERGRTFMALRGQITRADAGGKRLVIGSLGEYKDLAQFIKNGDWNEFHLIARGNTITHILNGHVMCVLVDDDAEKRKLDGLIGVQVHVGPPMKVEFREFRLKRL